MEHIIQFGVHIDDNAIIKRVEQRASDEIKTRIIQELFDRQYGKTVGFNYVAQEVLYKWCDANKEEIFELVSAKLAERLTRTKRVKQIH